MNRACRNCHFLVRHDEIEAFDKSGEVVGLEWTTRPWGTKARATRELQRDVAYAFGNQLDSCWRGVWDRRSHPSLKVDLDEDRGDTCYFFPWREGLRLDVADEMQRRQYDNRHLRRGDRIGLWITAIGIAITAILAILDFFFSSD